MIKLAHMTDYPDQIIVSTKYQKPKMFKSFKPDTISFTTKCDHNVYLEGLIFASDLLLTWKKSEEKIAREVNQEFKDQAWINYLQTMSVQYFFTPIGLSVFDTLVKKEYTSGVFTRFIELHSQIKVFINPAAMNAIQGRMIYYLLTANLDVAKSGDFIPVYRTGRQSLIVNNTKIFELLYDFPWLWMLPLYKTFDMYSEMMTLKLPK